VSATIYLVRHAIAGPAPAGLSDGDRRLTADGVRRMRRAAAGLKQLDVVPDVILSSPLQRAEETAAILADVLAPQLVVEIYPTLAPGHAPEEAVRGLYRYRAARTLMLVGHQPDLGQLASHLLTGTSTLVGLPFKKGGVAAIAVSALPPKSAGSLRWFVTPKQLRAMAS
jgi:phosphohistidine phosphatase